MNSEIYDNKKLELYKEKKKIINKKYYEKNKETHKIYMKEYMREYRRIKREEKEKNILTIKNIIV
jgi:hypothetical protein